MADKEKNERLQTYPDTDLGAPNDSARSFLTESDAYFRRIFGEKSNDFSS